MRCPHPDELLRYSAGLPVSEAASTHVSECSKCVEQVRWMRETIGAVHVGSASHSEPHASADTLAALADGGFDRVDRHELAHVSACATCISQLAMLSDTIDDPAVRAELDIVEGGARTSRSSRVPLRFLGGLAAAAVAAIVLLQPMTARREAAHREPGITTSEPPQVLSPRKGASVDDSIRWTAVPEADVYQVRIWNTEGAVVWSTETRQNAVAIPASLVPGTQYLWEVKARTGWDRWVESDLVPFSIRTR